MKKNLTTYCRRPVKHRRRGDLDIYRSSVANPEVPWLYMNMVCTPELLHTIHVYTKYEEGSSMLLTLLNLHKYHIHVLVSAPKRLPTYS